MVKRTAVILTLFVLGNAACGIGTTASPTPDPAVTTGIGHTPFPIVSSTPPPESPARTATAVPTKTAAETPSITPTASPTASPTTTPDRGYETIHTFSERNLIGAYPKIIVNNRNDFWTFRPSEIRHFQEGINDIQIPIDDLAEYAIEFAISPDNSIWLFDIGKWPMSHAKIRLLEMDENGMLLTEHILPQSILVDASGNYIEDYPDLWWESDGSLILGGDNYFYQLLDQNGILDVQRRRGFQTDSHVYRVLNNFGTQEQPALISIDEKKIPIVGNDECISLGSGTGWGFLGARPNGDFYVQVYEFSTKDIRVTSQRIAIRKYDMDGNLVEELVLRDKEDIPSWDKEIPPWQFPIVTMGRDGNLYAFLPGDESVSDRLVLIRMD